MFEKQFSFLTKSVELGRLPHALLFSGPEGIGKKDFALNFVRSVLKEEVGHPDFILLDSNKEIPIARIRELISKLSFKPYSAKKKFAIVNKAHLMTRESQNCFLKFLEEPTETTHLILITEYHDLLLSTILSRLQKVRFYSKDNSSQNEELIAELLKIKDSDLALRFKLAKSLADKDIDRVLNEWLRYFRKEMIASLPNSQRLSNIVKEIEQTKLLISSTNINPRLALEILLLKI